jgi:hypothetical protein
MQFRYRLILTALALFILSFLALSVSGLVNGMAEEPVVPQEIIVSPPGQTNQLSLSLWTERDRYMLNDALLIHFQVNQPAYVYIYDIDASGAVTLIYPNGYSRDNHSTPGEHTLPDRDNYSLVVGEPLGVEYLQAIALLQPIPLVEMSSAGNLDKEAFPVLGQSIEKVKPKVQKMITVTAGPGEWATAWTSFSVVSPQATLVVRSRPAGALVYVGGEYRGQTPIKLLVEPGKVEISLVKDGYQEWSETVTLKAQAQGELSADLERAQPLQPPPTQPGPPSFPGLSDNTPSSGPLLSSWAINFGLNPSSGVFSLGLDLGLSPFLGLGGSLTFTGEDVPDYFDVGSPQAFAREKIYNIGPELEADLNLRLPISDSLMLQVGGGLANQEQAHIAQPSGSEVINVSSTSAEAIQIKPNGYTQMENYVAVYGGFVITVGASSFELGYHSRRGWVIGFGGSF